jgi:hypothetical protein
MLLQKLEHDGHSLFIVTQISIYLRLIHSLSLLPTCVFDFCFCLFRVIWIFAKVIWVFFFFMSLSFGRAQWRFDMLLHVICFLLGVSFVFFFFFFLCYLVEEHNGDLVCSESDMWLASFGCLSAFWVFLWLLEAFGTVFHKI